MKILVAGSTGTVGRHLVEQLHSAGHEVRALTRDRRKANFSEGVEVVEGDLTVPSTLEAALEGVSGLHLITFGGDDYAPLENGAEIVALAEKAGVERVTLLKGPEVGSVELALEASSIATTYILPMEFMANMRQDWAPSICTDGTVTAAYGNRKTAIVHEADIAAVTAVALTQDGHGGQTYKITGGEVLTPRAMVQIISDVIGRDIQFIELTEAQARENWRSEGHSDEVIEFFVWVYANTPPEGYTVVPTVEQVTGKPPRTFRQWATENASHFI